MVSSSYLSLIALFAFAQLASLAEAQEVIEVLRWVVPYDGPKTFTANVGDTMIFRWAQGAHNVFVHPSMDCNLEGAISVGAESGTEYTFAEADGSPAGTEMFFACDIGLGAHCRAGQAITVTVFSDGEAEEPAIVLEAPPTDAPVEKAEATEAPIAAPAAEEAEASEAPVAAPAAEDTESDSMEATSGSPRVNLFATTAGLASIFLALVL